MNLLTPTFFKLICHLCLFQTNDESDNMLSLSLLLLLKSFDARLHFFSFLLALSVKKHGVKFFKQFLFLTVNAVFFLVAFIFTVLEPVRVITLMSVTRPAHMLRRSISNAVRAKLFIIWIFYISPLLPRFFWFFERHCFFVSPS